VLEITCDLLAGHFDGFAEGEPVWKAREAVAKHFGAERSLRLQFHGSVDDAEKAAGFGPVPLGQGSELNPVELSGNSVTIGKIQLPERVRASEEAVKQIRDRTALEALRVTPVKSGAVGAFNQVDEAAVVRGDFERALLAAFDDRSSNR